VERKGLRSSWSVGDVLGRACGKGFRKNDGT